MQSKARFLTLFICLVLTFSLLAGCGGGTGDQKPSANPQQSQEVAKAKVEDTLNSLFAKAKDVKGISYNMSMTSEGKQISKGKMWLAGKKMKMETSAEGMGTIIMFMDQEKSVAYSYIPAEKMATKINFDQAQKQQGESPLDYSKDFENNTAYKIVGEEKMNGYQCKLVEVTEKEGNVKMWVSVEYGIPVRVESKVEGKALIVDFTDIKVGDIADAEFQLPSGVQVIDMGQMMNNMPNSAAKQ